MKVELVLSTVGTQAPHQYCTTFVVNDSIAIDAGTLGLIWPIERQRLVRHVFLSHSHIDHIATLPLFLDNVFSPGPGAVTVYANAPTHESLQTDVFNGRLWPDFIKLSDGANQFLRQHVLANEGAVDVDGIKVTAVDLHHNVPTAGFVLESPDVAVAIVSDTGPTDRIWEVLNGTPNLEAVFLECSFPDSHRWLADEAYHLCPELFAAEVTKLTQETAVYACHIKPAFHEQVVGELTALNLPRVQLARPGHVYEFGD